MRVKFDLQLHFYRHRSQNNLGTVLELLPSELVVSRSAGCFGCYVTCPNAVSSRVIHLVFHRHQHNCFSSLDSIELVYQHPLERRSAATDTCSHASLSRWASSRWTWMTEAIMAILRSSLANCTELGD
jgi:hypothetical protein